MIQVTIGYGSDENYNFVVVDDKVVPAVGDTILLNGKPLVVNERHIEYRNLDQPMFSKTLISIFCEEV